VLVHRQRSWVRISAAAALCYRWDGRRARLYLHLRPGSYNDETLIEFIRQLCRHFRGQQVLLLWSNLKGRELANRCDLEIADTITAAKSGAERVRGNQQLLFGFLAQTGLSL
jgi:hypothetical protein